MSRSTLQPRIRPRATSVTLLLAVLAGLVVMPAHDATAAVDAGAERDFICRTNTERGNAGQPRLRVASDLTAIARTHAVRMADQKRLHHNPNLAQDVKNWQRVAENVGVGPSVTAIHDALMASDGHRQNILNAQVTEIGVGVERRDGRLWVTQVFRQPTSTSSVGYPDCSGSNSAVSSGDGTPVPAGGVAVVGDWNGDGRTTPGRFKDGVWYLSNTPSGTADIAMTFGRKGDQPLVGDWNGNGRDGVGIIRDRTWHLRDRLTAGAADRVFIYGQTTRGDQPIVGDWNGNGRDGVGIIRDGAWHLRQTPSSGQAQIVFTFGRITRGDLPLVGDWNGDGRDRIGIVRDGTWHLRHSLSSGPGERVFTYGRVLDGDQPMVGDWNRNARDGIAIVRGTDWHLRNALSGGSADAVHSY